MFWGTTPSLDLLEEFKKINNDFPNEINILLISASDVRHILKTLARRYCKKNIKINFYIMEMVPEIIAKELLLLNIALQPVSELGLVQKTRIFMEIFGNTLVRPVTAKYLTNRSYELIKMITNLDYMKEIMPFVNLEIKYKERDYLENLFKFWAAKDSFDIIDCWDRRLRKFLGIRYDTRIAAFDWDLHMRLHSIGGQQICPQEYQSFRRNGVAFTWLESEVTKANRSMVTGILTNGDNFGHYGYLGEMQTGPFIPYGLTCEDEFFLKKHNNMNKFRSTDITERNLREIFHEIEFNSTYKHQTTTDMTLGTCVMQLSDLKVIDTGNITPSSHKNGKTCLKIEGFAINFLSINNLNIMQHKDKYKDLFHIIYYGNSALKYLDKDVIQHIATFKCLLLVEHQLYILGYRDKELEEHSKNIEEKTKGLNKHQFPFDFKKDSYVKFLLN